MSRSRGIVAVALTVVTWFALVAPARAEGKWPAHIDPDPTTAMPAATVSYSGSGPVGEGPRYGCVVEFDGSPIPEALCSIDPKTGVIAGSFQVPNDAATNDVHTVSVCWPSCLDGSVSGVALSYWQANTELLVEPAVAVPDLRCLTARQAAVELGHFGLKARTSDAGGRVGVVIDQLPEAQQLVAQTSIVDLELGSVVVPPLHGLTYDEALTRLTAHCLRISATNGFTTGTVRRQDPPPGSDVPGGTFVSVTMSGPTLPPSTPVTSPLATSPAQAAGDPVSFPYAWTLVGLLLLVVTLLLAKLVSRAGSRRREAIWVRQHVKVTTLPGPPVNVGSRRLGDRNAEHVITVVRRATEQATTVEENPP
jgi:hypothetical protein